MFNRMVDEGLRGEESRLEGERSLKFVPRQETVWSPPRLGWLKSNMDDAFVNGRAAIGLVVRNDRGELVMLLTKIIASKAC